MHNTVYWERLPYKGFGLGACSFDGQNRIQNEKNLTKYLDGITYGTDITFFSEQLTQKQIFSEKLMLGLRRMCGLSLACTKEFLAQAEQEKFNDKVIQLSEQGFLCIENGNIRLTRTGLMLENEIVCRLMQ
jgi:oxygen-independent coproporphyrinogen-3 oxidase